MVHEGDLEIGLVDNLGAPPDTGVLHAKFARYPGCQQLTLWLPSSGHLGYTALRIEGPGGVELDRALVRDRLNGSVQMLFDTLAWPPGEIELTVAHESGWRHRLRLRKFAGVRPRAEPPIAADPVAQPESEPAPVRYRDGFGRILPNVDLDMRRQAIHDLAALFSRRLEYEGNFRAGTVTYVEGDLRLRFDHEMAAAPTHMVVEVPTPAQWAQRTGTALERRDQILRFVAETVQREQCSSWRFEIRSDAIVFT